MLYTTIEAFHQIPYTMKIFSFILSSLSFYMSLGAIFSLISFYEHQFQARKKKITKGICHQIFHQINYKFQRFKPRKSIFFRKQIKPLILPFKLFKHYYRLKLKIREKIFQDVKIYREYFCPYIMEYFKNYKLSLGFN